MAASLEDNPRWGKLLDLSFSIQLFLALIYCPLLQQLIFPQEPETWEPQEEEEDREREINIAATDGEFQALLASADQNEVIFSALLKKLSN